MAKSLARYNNLTDAEPNGWQEARKEEKEDKKWMGAIKRHWRAQAITDREFVWGQIKSQVISYPQAPKCITWYMRPDVYLSDKTLYIPFFYVLRGHRGLSPAACSLYQIARRSGRPPFSPLSLPGWKCWRSPVWRTGFERGSPRTCRADSSPRRESR